MELRKDSNTFKKANSRFEVVQTVSSSITGLSEPYHKTKRVLIVF